MQYLSKTESHPSHTRTLRVTPNPQPLCEAGGVTQTHNVGQEVSPKTTMWGNVTVTICGNSTVTRSDHGHYVGQ